MSQFSQTQNESGKYREEDINNKVRYGSSEHWLSNLCPNPSSSHQVTVKSFASPLTCLDKVEPSFI